MCTQTVLLTRVQLALCSHGMCWLDVRATSNFLLPRTALEDLEEGYYNYSVLGWLLLNIMKTFQKQSYTLNSKLQIKKKYFYRCFLVHQRVLCLDISAYFFMSQSTVALGTLLAPINFDIGRGHLSILFIQIQFRSVDSLNSLEVALEVISRSSQAVQKS